MPLFFRSVKPTKENHIVCKHQCRRTFDEENQQAELREYYAQPRETQDTYLLRRIEICTANSRDRSNYKGKRQTAWKYHLFKDSRPVQVCQEFFLCSYGLTRAKLQTLRKRINANGNPTPKPTHQPSTTISPALIDAVKHHIESFPCVESHYCRATTKRKYLDPTLSVPKMYELYVNKMVADNLPTVKLWKYNEVFTTCYNLGFHKPKGDLCDKCTAYENCPAGNITDEMRAEYNDHKKGKAEAKQIRDEDLAILDAATIVVSFDLENVFALPRTNVSSAFYKRKLNTFNLTAVEARSKKAYNAIWNQTTAGRSANDLASALLNLLHQISLDQPQAEKIILWSDSCVAQNRNKILAYALQLFIQEHPHIITIVHRYCEPGHSTIQNVDTLHSNIEGGLKGQEIHSPVTLVRQLCRIQPKGIPMYVHMMKDGEFYDFKSQAIEGSYDNVGFSTVREVKYSAADIRTITVKRQRLGPSETFTVLKTLRTRNKTVKPLPKATPLPCLNSLTKEKADDIRSLIKYMDGVDKIYYENLLATCKIGGKPK